MNLFVIIMLIVPLNGCGFLLGLPQVSSKDLPDIVKEIAKSESSLCAWIGGRGGSGAGAIPVPTMAGGYGSGEILIGRVNADNTKVTIKDGSCTIERGGPKATVP